MAQPIQKILFPAEKTAQLVEEPRDTAPLEADEVAGRTVITLVSAGTELNVYLGNYHREGHAWATFPCTPGYAAVFEIDAVGDAVTDVKPGDLAYCMGKHTSWQRVKRNAMLPLPEGMDPRRAVFTRMTNIGMSALTTTAARPPERVMVTGLGIVGLLAANIFNTAGYRVTAVDPDARRRELASASGLGDVRKAVPADDPQIAGSVAAHLECAAHEQAVLDGCEVMQPGGEIILIGVPLVRHTDNYAQPLLNRIFRKQVSVRSGSEWIVPRYPAAYRRNNNWGNMAAAMQWIHDQRIPVDHLYELRSPADPQKVYDDVLNQRVERLVVLLDWARL